MTLIKVKAKVLLKSEDQMELEGSHDMGNISRNEPEWGWRNIAIPYDEIYTITEFNKNKSIVILYSGDSHLVAEAFEELSTRWDLMRQTYGVFKEEDDTEHNEEGDTNSKDEDE
jgi:hypothetical protein